MDIYRGPGASIGRANENGTQRQCGPISAAYLRRLVFYTRIEAGRKKFADSRPRLESRFESRAAIAPIYTRESEKERERGEKEREREREGEEEGKKEERSINFQDNTRQNARTLPRENV